MLNPVRTLAAQIGLLPIEIGLLRIRAITLPVARQSAQPPALAARDIAANLVYAPQRPRNRPAA